MIPLRAARQSAVRRPVGFLGQKSRRIGRIVSHKASGISQMVPRGRGLFALRRRFVLVSVIPEPSARWYAPDA
jgi:hypothetical protein